MKKSIIFISIISLMSACSHKNASSVYTESSKTPAWAEAASSGSREIVPVKAKPTVMGPLFAMPDASVFRMSGDYADNVAITLAPDGSISYFPAPSDITADSKPINLGDGWWLNCQGVGQNSVFTKYTFAEYAELPETPSPEQLKLAVIPGAHVTEFKFIPIKASEAIQNPEAAKALLDK